MASKLEELGDDKLKKLLLKFIGDRNVIFEKMEDWGK